MDLLIITNGDSAAEALEQASLGTAVLPWRDVLHEGPVPAGLSLGALSTVRARFLAAYYGGGVDVLIAAFRARDRTLISHDADEVLLWFEHDLYDQLQLIQVLDHFAEKPHPNLRMACRDAFIAQTAAPDLKRHFAAREPVTQDQLRCAREAWAAFRAPAPLVLQSFIARGAVALPYLQQALLRFCEEYPSRREGLARSERQILEILRHGEARPGALFKQAQDLEAAAYLGDATFWKYVERLANGPLPLVAARGRPHFRPPVSGITGPFLSQTLYLTDAGTSVLAGKVDWASAGTIDRWMGGVHLTPRNLWRWDAQERAFSYSRTSRATITRSP